MIIHARPEPAPDEQTETLDGQTLQTVPIRRLETRFACSFEDVQQQLDQLPRMFLEPDGSFVWVVEQNQHRCQFDGNLSDDGHNLVTVELKSSCTGDCVNALLRACGWPRQRLLFQWLRLGVYLEESEFRRLFLSG